MHEWLTPTSLEIGTELGDSLSIATCAVVAVDPNFCLRTGGFVGKKPFCALYQMPSDTFSAAMIRPTYSMVPSIWCSWTECIIANTYCGTSPIPNGIVAAPR
jgi:hypothetical protein